MFSSSLKLSLDLYYTEDEIYELSYTREPKNCKAPVSDRSRDSFKLTPVSQLALKQDFGIWGDWLIHFLAELDERIDNTHVCVLNVNVKRNKLS